MSPWRNILFLWIFLCLLSGCGAHRAKRDLIVLLPDPDGKAGAITVTTGGGSQSLDKPGYAIVVEDPNQAPSTSQPMDQKEITDVFGPALSTLPDPASRFILIILYFERDTIKLTHESKDLLAEILRTVKRRQSHEVYVVGHTDLVGKEAYNNDLSQKRANYVRDLLVSRGIKPDTLFVSYYGKARPLVPTRDEVPEPRNRRVEVIVR
ncbi:MAG TPA: OmpA family protein [Thermodesulfobacteriota bacterium]|nr:OmpA family protein [Thermodesulfobacteriota bacterium]